MQVLIGLVLALGMTHSCSSDAILRHDFDGPAPDGTYRWAIQTEGGIYHEQRGSLQRGRGDASEPALLVEGQYQYTAPGGQIIHVLYRADEFGFHPKVSQIANSSPPHSINY